MTKENYKAEQIKVLEGLEAVRKRPAMYIGSTGKDGLHHLVYEVVDNSIDECLAGFCTLVQVTIQKDGGLLVQDNGRGIPVDTHPKFKKPALEIALTKLHAGGKFEKSAYQISGGLHGVGVSVVNALSIKLSAKVKRNGKVHQQEYVIGKPKYNMKTIGKCDKNETGTEILFYPDKEIFSTTTFDFSVLKKRLQEIAFLNPVKIILKDERDGKKEIFHYTGGLTEFVNHINKTKAVIHKPIYFKKELDGNSIEIAMQYTDGYNDNIFGFVNTINTTEGGTHISGFKTALTRGINDYITKKGMLKNEKLSGDDAREGIVAIVNVKMREPQFEGQTKTKLGNSEMKGIVDSMVYVALTEFLEENPSISNKIAQKVVASAKARNAARKARDLVRRKNAMGGLSGLPGKLSDCSSKKIEKTELYIVEGDSAAGSSKMAREKEFQAILPLKGKILNVEKSNPTKALSSEEIINLITAIGTGVKENFDIKKLRYNKVIIMTDADVDGQHIMTLLLTFFYRYVPELIENGNVYVAVSPLYRIRKKKDYYVYSDEELKKIVEKLGGTPDIQRFKGLGEMNPVQLWDTTMNPKTRILKKVMIEDAVLADETFSMLMGDVVAPRRKFIEVNANIAEVDI
ncbi:DNA topoisomerase (ATP-hydrolyzing) subunit B [archaeon]|jgi:DNA gyrase subunit B|nr:DNA topoisomerase (ATP-hydrolyzing) subunit B [archaeon]